MFVCLKFYSQSTLLRSCPADQLTYPHCSEAGFLSGLPVLSAYLTLIPRERTSVENISRANLYEKYVAEDRTLDLMNTCRTEHPTDIAGPVSGETGQTNRWTQRRQHLRNMSNRRKRHEHLLSFNIRSAC